MVEAKMEKERVKKETCLYSRTEKERLIKAIVEESKAIMDSHCMVRLKSGLIIKVERALRITEA